MSNSSCPNCNARLSCGCQRRQASNGAAACTSCVSSIEEKIKAQITIQPTADVQSKLGANKTN
jgi:transcription elongation factor Elf1